jgi:hypothetical protein
MAEQASSPRSFDVAGTLARHEKQKFHTHFDTDEVRVQPDDEGRGVLGLKLARIGCGEDRHAVAPGRREVAGNRVAYLRPELGLEEWYVHGRMGLEQGFTLAGPPCREVGELALEVGVSGGLVPVKTADGKGVEFWRGGQATGVRYGELHVVDAEGKVLASRLEVEGGAWCWRWTREGRGGPWWWTRSCGCSRRS